MLFPAQKGTTKAAEPMAAASPASGATERGDGVEINFDQADVQTVAKALLGDALGLNFIVDARITTPITLVATAPIARKDVLPALESALRMSNAALVRDHDVIRIMPISEANGAGPVAFGVDQPGFGVTIVPLRYTSAAALMKAAENFVSRPNMIRADTARNFILVQGSTNERHAVLSMIAGLDVEWMRNQSVGVYPLKSTSPATLVRELEQIFETGEGAQGAGTVKFQPISRMNAVMAMTQSPRTLERVTLWVRRLDRSDMTGTTVRIYRLENGNATKIAKILNEIFVGKGAGSTTSDSATSQIAPGASAAQSKLDSVSSGSAFGNSNSSNSSNARQASGAGAGQGGGQIAAAFENFNEKKEADAEAKSDASSPGSLPRGVFQNVRITADSSNNSIIVYSNQDDYRVIERSLRELDRPQMQVAIEATVAEVSLTDKLQYGVQYYLGNATGANASQANASAASTSTSSDTTSTASAVSNLVLQRVLPGFNLVLGPETRPHLILNALSTLTSVKVLSAPSLVVADNQPALLQVGQEIPISTGTANILTNANTVVNSYQMRDTGVILKVWPHVHGNGTIQLEVEQEISNATSTSLTPTISQRRVHSTISVTSGQTVMLGGMISEQDNSTLDGLPVLRRITYLGDLFGNTDKSKSRQEIIVFVKPQIIRNGFDAQGVSEEFRSRLESMRSVAAVVPASEPSPMRRVRK
ncbi:type II secretion system protein GspD (plasmid) [Methylosinus sp. C49]|uniref:type II secretion system secretin GspD n=1 Tax=Methylosinus sp. C49 TaxID=2699395 RepID=UPI0013672F64|nr:type II secretion system secretin GspD [Methylosinus sp. C49]BBU63766.1 type II secretion system protein GspD [Methylosinus sp. C49]